MVLPVFLAVILPFESIVATLVSPLCHIIFLFVAFAGLIDAVIFSLFPINIFNVVLFMYNHSNYTIN